MAGGLKTPCLDEVMKKYNPAQERIQEQNYRLDLQLKKLKWLFNFIIPVINALKFPIFPQPQLLGLPAR
jgi:hypothetical protein